MVANDAVTETVDEENVDDADTIVHFVFGCLLLLLLLQ